MTPLKSTITTTTAALALLLLLLVLVPTTVEAKKKGKAARLEMHGDRTIDVQPFDDDPTEFNCRLHDSKHGKATKGNPQYCETAGGASIMVIESYDNDDDEEDDEDRRTRVLKGGAKKKPKKYVTSIIGKFNCILQFHAFVIVFFATGHLLILIHLHISQCSFL